ncbi:hypothetical protein HHK36_027988 [Tetracentron sinense]|uniref:J domain-containing protein n=1 Tax=Tetracentron sinense TaxID=13715 RepID=A0A835D414_TETSI|nr:hypothetical protein HHK36_027988 [Tetracentron sinense]
MEEKPGTPHRELYALLHISPEATDEEIRKAYRQWAQVYHPDKYQSLQAILSSSSVSHSLYLLESPLIVYTVFVFALFSNGLNLYVNVIDRKFHELESLLMLLSVLIYVSLLPGQFSNLSEMNVIEDAVAFRIPINGTEPGFQSPETHASIVFPRLLWTTCPQYMVKTRLQKKKQGMDQSDFRKVLEELVNHFDARFEVIEARCQALANSYQSLSDKIDAGNGNGNDLSSWLAHAERYMGFYNIPEEQRVDVTAFHLEGEAFRWFEWMEYMVSGIPWMTFKEALLSRFGPTAYEDYFGEPTKLCQTDSLRDYQIAFERLSNRTTSITQTNLAQQFSCIGELLTEGDELNEATDEKNPPDGNLEVVDMQPEAILDHRIVKRRDPP